MLRAYFRVVCYVCVMAGLNYLLIKYVLVNILSPDMLMLLAVTACPLLGAMAVLLAMATDPEYGL